MRAVAALKEGGLDVLEVTMTVPGAIEVIRALARNTGLEL
jgi:2-dehydro-3-deoxyphosphogluconate aldolase/(4S)-4-hydroxy-2-oxoglutarate aldolase